MSNIRNFCIIAHIDHGKSTLADRFLELTGTVDKRHMKNQMLDQMDLERERGITIKLQPVRMKYLYENRNKKLEIGNLGENKKLETENNGQFPVSNFQFPTSEYILNLIDTPGHVDFTYEVSRSLAAVEGAILLVDASQGVQAQTIGNLYLALEQNLTIIPVLNKIDLPNADIAKATAELVQLIGCKPEDILRCSGKTGEGVPGLLESVIQKIPAPAENSYKAARALIFDSLYDDYRGVVASVRMVDGSLKHGDRIRLMQANQEAEILELGHHSPGFTPDTTI
ncbi:MAG: GTP-binding protein, partial [Bacteroidota bacterium]